MADDGPAVTQRLRRLVDEPTVHSDDLPTPQRDYARDRADEVITAARLGLDLRVGVRAEGAAVIDEGQGGATRHRSLQLSKCSSCSVALLRGAVVSRWERSVKVRGPVDGGGCWPGADGEVG
ncbi:DUF2398 family protein [Streptomyces sp. SLBN-8D4]|uniref:DUF2398 family protein n=1 Tax=Streptomyces sp. SLBN-8D4 TaxID=3377728 RepID=UPI003C7C90B4